MNDRLRAETERLRASWMRHESASLRDYLVDDVEDPRLNVQSILTRHWLLDLLAPGTGGDLKDLELRYALFLNWLLTLLKRGATADDFAAIGHALQVGGDNAEGIDIPGYVAELNARLPCEASSLRVPQLCRDALQTLSSNGPPAPAFEQVCNQFLPLWRPLAAALPSGPLRVLEVACGSANDYRFLVRSGIAARLEYLGVDLCAKNIDNARLLFPEARFEVGNVLELEFADRAFDAVFVHDLLEHLSPEAMEVALDELCRVARHAVAIGFFHMDEEAEDVVQPFDAYHWNRLSYARMRERFERRGAHVQVWNLDTFLRRQFGFAETHNPLAYSFFARFKAVSQESPLPA
jgi:SAM-dependent methyltransferase